MPTSTIKSCLKAVTVCAVLFLAAVGIKSFVPSGDGREVAPPVPDAVVVVSGDDIRMGSSKMFEDLRSRYAANADAVAELTEQFEDWQSAMDEWKGRNDAARLEAQKHCVAPLDAFLKDGKAEYGPYDPKRFAEGLGHVSKGFREGSR